MKKTHTRTFQGIQGFIITLIASTLLFPACTPEGVINKTKYQGKKITNTCDQFSEEISQIVNSNNNPAELVVAQFDNSDFDHYQLEPGQYEIKDGILNFRLAQDLEYDKYLTKGIAVHVIAAYTSMDHLSNMENPSSGDLGMMVIDRAYFDAHKDPFFLYQMPLNNNAELNGKQISLKFSVVKYKKGKVKKEFCNSVEVPLGPVTPACCTYQAWDKADPKSVIEMPDVKIDDEKYRYKGFVGTLDFIFDMGSTQFDKNLLSEAVQDYIKKYNELGYQIASVTLEGYASLGGKEEANQTLSEKRAQAVYDDLTKSLGDPNLNISSAGKGEDWSRFDLLTKASALAADEQRQVLDIAGQAVSNDEKEAQLRKLPFWTKLVDEVIVNTRHTFVTFKFDYTPDKMYVETYPSQMPVISDELYNVASKEMMIRKFASGENTKKNLKVLDILIGNVGGDAKFDANRKANLFAMRSTYHFAENNFRTAISDIEKALSFNQTSQQYAMAALAYKTKYAGEYSLDERMEMMETYNTYVQKYPDNKTLFFNRAVMMDKVGYISGALAEYNDLLEGNEPSAANLNNRGVAKLKTMRTTEAEADFEAAIEKGSNLCEAYFNLALVYAYKGLTNKCVENLDRAIACDPGMKAEIFSNPAFSVMKDTPKFDKYR